MQNHRYSSLTTIDAARRDEVIIRCVTCGQEHQSVDSDQQSMSNNMIVIATGSQRGFFPQQCRSRQIFLRQINSIR